jgi:hypothetical protein
MSSRTTFEALNEEQIVADFTVKSNSLSTARFLDLLAKQALLAPALPARLAQPLIADELKLMAQELKKEQEKEQEIEDDWCSVEQAFVEKEMAKEQKMNSKKEHFMKEHFRKLCSGDEDEDEACGREEAERQMKILVAEEETEEGWLLLGRAEQEEQEEQNENKKPMDAAMCRMLKQWQREQNEDFEDLVGAYGQEYIATAKALQPAAVAKKAEEAPEAPERTTTPTTTTATGRRPPAAARPLAKSSGHPGSTTSSTTKWSPREVVTPAAGSSAAKWLPWQQRSLRPSGHPGSTTSISARLGQGPWKRATGEDGASYFYHPETGETIS